MVSQLKWTYTKRPEGQEYTLKLEVKGKPFRRYTDIGPASREINGKMISLYIIIHATDTMLSRSTDSYSDRNKLVNLACQSIEQNPYQEEDDTEASQSGTSATMTRSTS